MNMPYKTSRDYQLLKKLLDEGKEIVCFTDFPIDNRIFRDVCKARKIGEGRYSVTCRGCEYASFWDERMRRCDTERVGRVVNHFQNDDNAYFMVINAPNTEVHLITGEIGICSLLTGQRGHFELPRVSYQTSKGNVVLFPDEIMPVDINLLQQEINEGYIMLSDGRYLPPKEAVQQCYNAFGIRVGLGDNWEDIYDGWNKEMK